MSSIHHKHKCDINKIMLRKIKTQNKNETDLISKIETVGILKILICEN